MGCARAEFRALIAPASLISVTERGAFSGAVAQRWR